MGISNDINATNRVSNANGYSNHHNMVNGNGVAEKAIRSCHDPAHGGSVINFNPGPAKIAPSVLSKAQEEMVLFRNHGISVMEMSHRSAEFASILNSSKEALTELIGIPDNYKILFLQGGASAQFSAVPLNLLHRASSHSADYIVTGTWSAKAIKEAEKYGDVRIANQRFDKYTRTPKQEELDLNPNASYVYYCDNETVNGIEFSYIPETGDVPLVVDMSSNILSRPFDISKHLYSPDRQDSGILNRIRQVEISSLSAFLKGTTKQSSCYLNADRLITVTAERRCSPFGIVLAGAQKNIGCAGVTLAIVREDLVGYCMKTCPSVLDYKVQIGMNSLYNTPPSYSIYMMSLVLEWIKECGGLNSVAKNCAIKSGMVYSLIDNSDGFYCCSVDKDSRSRMNVTFRIGRAEGDPALEEAFIAESKEAHMLGLKGHRSVGGIRASLYNAVTVEDTTKLVELMKNFHSKHT